MDKFGLIGDPISKSLSPKIFEAAYNGKYQYDLIQTPDFEKAWNIFLSDYKAINITSPFKVLAFNKADIISPESMACGASNICVKTAEGIKAYNSDYLGVKSILSDCGSKGRVAIIGFGGAGKAAFCAAKDCGFECKVYRHNEIVTGLQADVVIYTLPSAVEGIDKIKCNYLLEANYKNPALSNRNDFIYIPGTKWLEMQAVLGYAIMTGEEPIASLSLAMTKTN